MSKILHKLRQRFSPAEPIPMGIYHYISPQDDPRNYRLHLRVERDGSGLLIVNASTILHLNQTATEYAYYLVKNINPEEVGKLMAKRYDISSSAAQEDYQKFIDRIQTLINTPDLDPVTFLGFDRMPPFTGYISAPYRLDCAITYLLPDYVDPEVAPTERVEKELSTDQWLTLIDKAAEIGIPHLVFTGGEPTMRNDLPDLLLKAEQNNQVTGLLTDGLKFSDQVYLDKILMTGLDHTMIIFNTQNDDFWTALKNTLNADLYVAVHLTITDEIPETSISIINRFTKMGVGAISLSTNDPSLEATLQQVRDYAAESDLELVWNLPVPYSASNPVAFETTQSEVKEGAGRAWLYIEPDGDVLPSQGINRVLGNILEDNWEDIWMRARSD